MNRPEPTLGNPKNTIEILQKYKFVFQKKFGQNFLIDEHVLEKIIQAAGVGPDDFVVEIGPGIGTMTQYLAHAARGVAAVTTSAVPARGTQPAWGSAQAPLMVPA